MCLSKKILAGSSFVGFIALFALFFDTKYWEVTSAFFLVLMVFLLIKVSSLSDWKKLFPNIMGGIIAGLILLTFTVDEIKAPKWEVVNFVINITALCFANYFSQMEHLKVNKKK